MPVNTHWRTSLFLAVLLVLASPADADEPRRFSIGDEPAIPIEAFGDSPRLLIWLPNEAGPQPARRVLLRAPAARGTEVWDADLPAARFAPPGRAGLRQFDPAVVARLLEAARRRGKRRVALIGSDRGALLALRVARSWQLARPDARPLDGVILLDPLPYDEPPAPGQPAHFAPILRATNLPVFLLQPEKSTRFPHRLEIAEALLAGGAPLFAHVIPKAHSGFQERPESEFETGDRAARDILAARIDHAMRQLARAPRANHAAPLASTPGQVDTNPGEPMLQAWRGALRRLPLRLPDLDGRVHDLAGYRGKVVLVNFWASWCPPCVEELPSLIRLKRRLAGKAFEILGVDIGEPADTVRAFLRDFEIDYPILLDPNAKGIAPWRVYAYPSSFLVAADGHISHAYRGGLAWDSDAVVKIIEGQLASAASQRKTGENEPNAARGNESRSTEVKEMEPARGVEPPTR